MPQNFTFEERIIQDIYLLSARDDFAAEVDALGKKHRPFFDSMQDVDEDVVLYDEALEKPYQDDLVALCKKYKLSELHESYLSVFINEGKVLPQPKLVHFIHLNPSVTVHTKNCITLQIFPDTTLKDVISQWPRIRRMRDNLPTGYPLRKNKIENLERDLYILNLKRKGLSAKEIANQSNKKYRKSLVGYADIPIIISRLKTRANRLLTSKKS